MEEYQKRMMLEYSQLHERYKKLRTICAKYHAGKLEFELKSPIEVLEKQLYYMEKYLFVLEVRASIENLTLSD